MPNTNEAIPSDEIDLRQVVAVLWRRRIVILALGFLGSAFGLAASRLSTQYVSSGLLQAPTSARLDTESINAANYKRYENMLFDASNLQQFLSHLASDTPGHAEVSQLASNPNALRKTITPEFSLTEKEQRALGVKLSSEQAGTLLGFRVRYAASTPSHGTALELLGEYLRDTVLRLDLRRYMAEQCERSQASEIELRNEQLKADFFIQQEQQRLQYLKRLLAQNPAAAAADSRQIISLDNNGARYLSPRVHLTATEIAIADARLGQSQRDRDTMASKIKTNYYCEASRLQGDDMPARAYLDRLPALQATALGQQDKRHTVVEQTANDLALQRQAWRDNYLRAMRFVSPPSESQEHKESRPSLPLGLLLGGVVGGFLGMVAALLLSWWANNRDEILTSK